MSAGAAGLGEALALFDVIVDLGPEDREAHLATAPPGVASMVRGMLEADRTSRRLATGIGQDVLAADVAREPAPLPRDLPGYRILGELGSGGMGRVLDAEQESPKRRVALKILHPYLVGDRTRAWLRDEAFAQASLLHPGIPQVYAIEEHEGLLFLVMERVEGDRLDRACRDLPVRRRVELVAQVGDAVTHAHGRGLLHLDLKPANVLVTAEGRVKVLDFGLARALDAGKDGVVAGTPDFMAPEQQAGAAVDVRTDVFGLGRVLGRVLVGVDTDTDLDAILGRATAATPSDRYPSAEAFAADLRRYIGHFPVEARAGGTVYRASRYVRRNPVPVLAASLIALALLLGTGLATERALTAERARQDADRARQDAERALAEALQAHEAADAEARRATATRDFLQEVFLTAHPEHTTGERTLQDAVDTALTRLDEGAMAEAPTDQAALRVTLADGLHNLGRHAEAKEQYVRAIAAYEGGANAPDATLIEALQGLSIVTRHGATGSGDYYGTMDQAKALLDRAIALCRTLDDQPRLANLMHTKAVWTYTGGDFVGARDLFETVLATKRPLHASGRLDVAGFTDTLSELAYMRWMTGDFDGAQAALQEAWDAEAAVLPENHPELASTLHWMAMVAIERGDPERGLELVEQVQQRRDALGIPSSAMSRRAEFSWKGRALADLGRWDAAAATIEALVDIDLDGDMSRLRRETAWTLIRARAGQGRVDEAQALVDQAFALDEKAREGSGGWAWAYTVRGRWRESRGLPGAEEDLQTALSVWEPRFTARGPRPADLLERLERVTEARR